MDVFYPSKILATENQSHGSRGSMVIRHAMLFTLVLDTRGSSPIIRADDRTREGVIQCPFIVSWPPQRRMLPRARERFRVTFFAGGTSSCLQRWLLCTQHLTYSGRNISPAYFRDRVTARAFLTARSPPAAAVYVGTQRRESGRKFRSPDYKS